jgi:hypothetical protein
VAVTIGPNATNFTVGPGFRFLGKGAVIGRRACGWLKILGAALQADGETRSRISGFKRQKDKRSMKYFAGLDVSVKATSVYIVDDIGKVVREVKVASELEALLAAPKNPVYRFKQIGLEAGPL